MKPTLGRRILRQRAITSKPAVAKVGREEGDDWNDKCVRRHLTVQPLEFHQPFSRKTIVEKLIDEVVILPVGHPHISCVPSIERNRISVFIDHLCD